MQASSRASKAPEQGTPPNSRDVLYISLSISEPVLTDEAKIFFLRQSAKKSSRKSRIGPLPAYARSQVPRVLEVGIGRNSRRQRKGYHIVAQRATPCYHPSDTAHSQHGTRTPCSTSLQTPERLAPLQSNRVQNHLPHHPRTH